MRLVFTKWACAFLLCCWVITSGVYSGKVKNFVNFKSFLPYAVFILQNDNVMNTISYLVLVLNWLFEVEGLHRGSKVRGVNLGGWLVIEGWIKPSLFDGIANGDMLVSYFHILCPHFSFYYLNFILGFLGTYLADPYVDIEQRRMGQRYNLSQ